MTGRSAYVRRTTRTTRSAVWHRVRLAFYAATLLALAAFALWLRFSDTGNVLAFQVILDGNAKSTPTGEHIAGYVYTMRGALIAVGFSMVIMLASMRRHGRNTPVGAIWLACMLPIFGAVLGTALFYLIAR